MYVNGYILRLPLIYYYYWLVVFFCLEVIKIHIIHIVNGTKNVLGLVADTKEEEERGGGNVGSETWIINKFNEKCMDAF